MSGGRLTAAVIETSGAQCVLAVALNFRYAADAPA